MLLAFILPIAAAKGGYTLQINMAQGTNAPFPAHSFNMQSNPPIFVTRFPQPFAQYGASVNHNSYATKQAVASAQF